MYQLSKHFTSRSPSSDIGPDTALVLSGILYPPLKAQTRALAGTFVDIFLSPNFASDLNLILLSALVDSSWCGETGCAND